MARGQRHPRAPTLPPVDIHQCGACGSMVTWPVPQASTLRALYASFDQGIDPRLRALRAALPTRSWYQRAALRAARLAGRSRDDAFTWIDLGAGGGELGAALNVAFPNARGTSVDWGDAPAVARDARHLWRACDLGVAFDETLSPPADVVTALSVWEHVRDPAAFVAHAAALVKPGGVLYLVCPDYGSLARRALGRWWPYWIPGEHLHVPTLRGARACLAKGAGVADRLVFARPIGIPYAPAYVAGVAGFPRFARLIRSLPAVPLPVGALEAGIAKSRAG